MTATNHMMTGAVIAAAVQQPLIVVPLAFLSHFALDMLPHFGVEEHDPEKRNKQRLFRVVLTADISVLVIALIALPLLLHTVVSWWILLLGMVFAWLPDMVWVRHFWRHHRGRPARKQSWLTVFHQYIQWFERPIGLVMEVAWLGGTLTTLAVVAR